jgi:hypothetical protein
MMRSDVRWLLLCGAALPLLGGCATTKPCRCVCPKPPALAAAPCSQPTAGVDSEVTVLVLTDKRCKECGTGGIEETLRARFFPKLKVQTLDWAEPAAKKLYKELGVKYLPALLFAPGVEKTARYPELARWMVDLGRYRLLKMPAHFDPTGEICDNNIDDNGDGKIDCDDPTCKGELVCRAEIKRHLQVFVMSQCPYGAQGLLAMREVLKNFKGKVAFDVHYIGDRGDDGKLSSMHGPAEVAENIRQLCARKHYPKQDRYLKYVWCRSKDYSSESWQSCAKDGIAAKVIDACVNKEGEGLLAADMKVAQKLRISASPTWLANNRHKFNGITADGIKTELCKHNAGLAGCEKKLSDEAVDPGSCGD